MKNQTSEIKKPVQKAVLVGVQLPGMTEAENTESLKELERLVTTLGYQVLGHLSQKRSSTRTGLVLGEGKLKDLASWTGGTGVVAPQFVKKDHRAKANFHQNQNLESSNSSDLDDEELDSPEGLEESEAIWAEEENSQEDEAPKHEIKVKAEVVIFDCELSPSQLRNLESATGAQVLDRTGVIIEIFSRHARTRAARLQVEIARLTYTAPRLRETGGNEDRGGGGMGSKGAGETSLELDRRHIRDRIKELKTELSSIDNEHLIRRSRRQNENCVALVGYTNAGKSSLMRALTGSEVLVADQLFATLDTTVRSLHPETKPKILISDTVGFIKKLPHDLVASFKSTLDEAHHAKLLLFVVDASDASFRSQLEVTKQVLNEIEVNETPSILILNKQDRLSSEEKTSLKQEFPDSIMISTRSPEDVANLRLKLIEFFEKDMQEADIEVEFQNAHLIGEIHAQFKVLSENYSEKAYKLRIRGETHLIKRIQDKILKLKQEQ